MILSLSRWLITKEVLGVGQVMSLDHTVYCKEILSCSMFVLSILHYCKCWWLVYLILVY